MKIPLIGFFILFAYTMDAQAIDNHRIVEYVNSQKCDSLWTGSEISAQNLMFIDTVGVCELKDLWRYTGASARDSLQEYCSGVYPERRMPLRRDEVSFGWTISEPLNGYRLIEILEYIWKEYKVVSRLLILVDTKGNLIFCTKYSH